MKKLILLLIVLGIVPSLFSQSKREFEMPDGDTVYVMKQYWMCLLYKGENREGDSATIAQIQKAHLDRIKELALEGIIQVAGPFGHNGDLRGLFVYDVDTKEEAIEYAESDPAIKADRLRYEIYPWWCGKGTVFK